MEIRNDLGHFSLRLSRRPAPPAGTSLPEPGTTALPRRREGPSLQGAVFLPGVSPPHISGGEIPPKVNSVGKN